MSITEIREKLHQIIDSSDEQLLERLLLVVEDEENEKDFWDELTPEQQARINKSWEQSNDPTKCIPHAEAMKRFDEWKKTLK